MHFDPESSLSWFVSSSVLSITPQTTPKTLWCQDCPRPVWTCRSLTLFGNYVLICASHLDSEMLPKLHERQMSTDDRERCGCSPYRACSLPSVASRTTCCTALRSHSFINTTDNLNGHIQKHVVLYCKKASQEEKGCKVDLGLPHKPCFVSSQAENVVKLVQRVRLYLRVKQLVLSILAAICAFPKRGSMP